MTEQPEPAFRHCEERSDVAIQASGTSLRGAECRGNLFLSREFFANFAPSCNKGDAMRFKDAAERWFEKKATLWSESSRAKYENILQKHLLLVFSDVELVGFDSALVRDFTESTLEELAVSSRRFVLATLQQILKSSLLSEDFGALDFPYAGMTRKGVALPLSPKELAALIDALEKNENPRYENSAQSLLLIAFTGMRLGEACALKLSDFDFVRNTIKIHETRERLPNENAAAEQKGTESYTSGKEIRLPGFGILRLKLVSVKFGPVLQRFSCALCCNLYVV